MSEDAAAIRRAIPSATIARLPVYHRALVALGEGGDPVVSSTDLATRSGVSSSILRKDLSHLGSYGTRGVGYDVPGLLDEVARVLGLTQDWAVVIVGVGNLGHALAGYGGFAGRGIEVVGLFDADPQRIGEVLTVGGRDLAVRPVAELSDVVHARGVAIGVIATPAGAAQSVANRLVAAGVGSILNFAPVALDVPGGVELRQVDLAVELQILGFHERARRGRAAVTA